MPQTALITGASAGLGAEFARQLAARGIDLILVARRLEQLEAVAAELPASVRCTLLSADLSCASAVTDIVAATAEQPVDWLINNAGSGGEDLLEHRNWEDHARFAQLMMGSVAALCHHFVPAMRERGFGRVINVASVAGRIAQAGGCNYGPSKAYVIALSEELSQTLHGTGVHVSALCPGFTHTDFHEVAGLQNAKAAMPKWLWYDAATVVRDGLRAVDRGKPIALSGRLYRWLDPLLQSVWTRPLVRLLTRAPKRQWRDSASG